MACWCRSCIGRVNTNIPVRVRGHRGTQLDQQNGKCFVRIHKSGSTAWFPAKDVKRIVIIKKKRSS
jgi:hypothetical protein